MVTDMALMTFIVLYFTLVIGSMGFLMYAWYIDKKARKKPRLRIVRDEQE